MIDRYVPMSQDIGRWLTQEVGVDPRKIRQLYSGVDTVRFSPSSGGNGVSRVSDTTFTIGTVGRLDPVKNQGALMEAMVRLGSRLPAARLKIVGDGPLMDPLKSMADRLGITALVEFTGARTDTPDLMRKLRRVRAAVDQRGHLQHDSGGHGDRPAGGGRQGRG